MPQFGKAPALVVIQTQAPSFKPQLQDSVLLAQERDHVLLLTVKPTAEPRDHELERKHC